MKWKSMFECENPRMIESFNCLTFLMNPNAFSPQGLNWKRLECTKAFQICPGQTKHSHT